MSIAVATTPLVGTTFDFLRQRVNDLANAMSSYTVTVNSNTATGNVVVNGTIQAVTLYTNTLSGATTINANGQVGTVSNLTITSMLILANSGFFTGGSISVGNSGTNTIIANGQITVANIIASSVNTSILNVGANVSLSTTQFFMGNSTVNAVSNSSVDLVQNSTISTSYGIFANWGANVTANSTALATANSLQSTSMTAAGLVVGNSTINAIISATSLKVANSTANITITVPTAAQSGGTYFLNGNGSWVQVSVSTPGSNTQVIYNDSGVTAASAGMVFNKVSNNFTISNTITAAVLVASTLANVASLVIANSTVSTTVGVPSTTIQNQGLSYLNANGSWVIPGAYGSNTHVQFNDSGSVNASSSFTYDKVQVTLMVANTLNVGNSTVNTSINSVNGIKLANSTVNTAIILPNTVQYGTSAGQWFLNANGTWTQPLPTLKSVSIPTPTTADDITMFWTNTAMTLAEVRSVVRGTSPSVTFTLYYGPNRNGTSNTVIQSGIVCSNVTSGNIQTSFSSSSIPANSFVWYNCTSTSGTVNEIALTLRVQ